MSLPLKTKPCFPLTLPLRGWLLLIAMLFFHTFSLSQTYYFDSYGPTEGVSSKVYAILQDHNHMIWLATPEGVTQFDGNQFTNFSSENGMASQGVQTLMQDSHNNIWFGHLGGGISVYRNSAFSVFPVLDSLINSDITSIFEDLKGRLWIACAASGAFMFPDPLGTPDRFHHFVGKDNLSDQVFNYCLAKDNTVYLITDAGIRKFIEEENRFEVFHPRGLTSYFITIRMFQDHRDHFWFGTFHGGLYKYEPENDTVLIYDKRDGLSSNWISAIAEDRKGNIWIGTFGGGITRISDNGFRVYNTENGLEAGEILSILEDVEGNILIGSSKKGFSIYKGDLIENYGIKEGLKNSDVYAITQDHGKNYWIGTNKGITVLAADMKTPVAYYSEKTNQVNLENLPQDVKVRFLKIDRDQTMWIGTEDQRVLFLNSISQKIQDAFQVNLWFSGSDFQVSAMEIDHDNNLWIGTRDGLLKYIVHSGEIVRFSNEVGLIGNNISAIYCDRLNQTWVGAYLKDGISKITEGNKIRNHYSGKTMTPSCFVLDNKGKVWIGSKGQGLFLLEKDSIAEQPEINAGLLSNLINTLDVDENNIIYIGTNKGLNIYNQSSQQIMTYNQKNGFLGIETNPFASYYNKEEGLIWFGTNQGINKFTISESKATVTEPLIYLTRLTVNQKEHQISPQIRLRSNENQISISFKSICLTNSDAVRYRYILEGLDADWQETTTQTTITYQSLPPEKYCFKAIARNSQGVWSSQPVSLGFSIAKPFYTRWYIILAAVMIILSLFGLYIKIRERNLIREKKILEVKVKDRTLKLEEANNELANKNKDITDSIRYALRIQLSILPPEIPFRNTFVLFKPKDIVSGDFYWLAKIDGKEIIAAIDCTGHGVPGAFMSFVGYSSLNEVVKEKRITQPSLILDKLNEAVVTALNLQGEEAIKDGMDLAIICYDQKKSILEYAGAYNPLYLITKGELQEYKANRFAIGKSAEKNKRFTNHTIKINKGDIAYIFSDGYADQFGESEQKKFKAFRVKELLTDIHAKNMQEQKQLLDDAIEKWRGNTEQIDDILFMGRRF